MKEKPLHYKSYGNWSSTGGVGNKISVEVPENCEYMEIYFNNGSSDTTGSEKYMVSSNEELYDTYEPYVGGQAAPNPEYNFPIRNVGDNVNLFDKDNANILNAYADFTTSKITTSATSKLAYLEITGGKTYTVSKILSTRFRVSTTAELPAINVTTIDNLINDNGTVITINTSNNSKYLCIGFYNASSDTLTEQEILDSIKVEEGTVATGYSPYNCGGVDVKVESANVPHEEQTVTFPLEEGQLLHLGDTLEDDGIHQRRAIKVLDGTESFEQFAIWGNYHRCRCLILNAKTFTTNDNNGQLSSHFSYNKTGVFSENSQTLAGIFAQYHDSQYFYFVVSQTTLTEFKAFLAEQYANGTPVTLESVLAEPIIVPYNEEQQKAYDKIKALYSYEGTTYISSDNGPSPIFKIQYYKEE